MSNSLCYPTDHQILDQLTAALSKMQPKYVFVVSEIDDIVTRFKEDFPDVKFIQLDKKNPHVELAVLGKADHAIVNCVSVSSAFVKRHRDVDSLPTEFWSFKKKESAEHKEL
jgi:peptide-O-fucosyltransferase